MFVLSRCLDALDFYQVILSFLSGRTLLITTDLRRTSRRS
jgi:hypothetical protein|eukprot:COSAG02_NODE_3877_length_6101_cov_2.939020_2_plen_40_part_00